MRVDAAVMLRSAVSCNCRWCFCFIWEYLGLFLSLLAGCVRVAVQLARAGARGLGRLMTFPWCNFNCRHRHSRLASPNSSRVQSRPTCLTMPVNSAHHNHVPTVANIGGHLIEPAVRPLCNFDCPRLGTTTSRVCIHELCGVAFSDTWGRVGFGSGRSRCCSCGAIVLLLSPAYSLDACRPAEQPTADGLAKQGPGIVSGAIHYAADVMTSIN